MARTKSFKAIIKDKNYYEDLLWMSYRYCIGRKTITSHSHAGDMAKYSYGVLSEEREEFMAQDMRKLINDAVGWQRNCCVSDYRQYFEEDALTSIFKELINRGDGEKISKDTLDSYNYSVKNGIVEIRKRDFTGELYESIISLYSDLIVWIKLANLYDKKSHKIVSTEYEGKTEEYECFSYPLLHNLGNNEYTIEIVYCDIDKFVANPYIDRYIDNKYITNIKNIA